MVVVVGIHQLHYLPWLRYFEKIAASDVFIVLDNIQFNKNGWQNRNRIKSAQGPVLLTVPVYEREGQRLDEVRVLRDSRWRKKQARTVMQSYGRAPYFRLYAEFFEQIYGRDWDLLNELNRRMLDYFLAELAIPTRIVYASDLDVPGIATERLINLVHAVGGTHYYSGSHAADAYLDKAAFERAGVGLVLQHWVAPVYPQLHGEFVPDLAILDLLMNCGPDSLRVLRENAS